MYNRSSVQFKLNSGFTLIEVLLVAMLIALFAGLVFPRLATVYKATQFDSAVRSVAAVIDYAKVRASAERTFLRIVFDREEAGIQVERQVVDDVGRKTYVPLAGRYGKKRSLPKHVAYMLAGDPVLHINPDGSVEKKRIVLEWEDRRRVSIVLDGYFGEPTITELVN